MKEQIRVAKGVEESKVILFLIFNYLSNKFRIDELESCKAGGEGEK